VSLSFSLLSLSSLSLSSFSLLSLSLSLSYLSLSLLSLSVFSLSLSLSPRHQSFITCGALPFSEALPLLGLDRDPYFLSLSLSLSLLGINLSLPAAPFPFPKRCPYWDSTETHISSLFLSLSFSPSLSLGRRFGSISDRVFKLGPPDDVYKRPPPESPMIEYKMMTSHIYFDAEIQTRVSCPPQTRV
jgi:hypothetical protein